jgi:hypothetical protein
MAPGRVTREQFKKYRYQDETTRRSRPYPLSARDAFRWIQSERKFNGDVASQFDIYCGWTDWLEDADGNAYRVYLDTDQDWEPGDPWGDDDDALTFAGMRRQGQSRSVALDITRAARQLSEAIEAEVAERGAFGLMVECRLPDGRLGTGSCWGFDYSDPNRALYDSGLLDEAKYEAEHQPVSIPDDAFITL